MDTLELKSNFHKLIDKINDVKMLNVFYEIMFTANSQSDGVLWSELSSNEKQELIDLEMEGHQLDNLVSNSEMKKKNIKWL